MAVISVDGLTKDYGEVVANDDLSFEVDAGEVFGYLGPNGAGKTTTIRMLMGFQSPTAGTATVLGQDVRDERALRTAKAEMGYLPGNPSFDGSVTGQEFLDYQAALKGDERREELLELFDPPLDRKIREYSTGNRQMLGIVQAFMHDPDLVVMDEPTSGLDPLKQSRFNAFLREERDRGVTVFFSSHVLSEVQRVCDRVAIIRNGSLVALEDVSDLLGRGGKHVDLHVGGSVDRAAFDIEGVTDLAVFDGGVQFTYTGEYDALLELVSSYEVLDLTIEDPPLDELFLRFYGDETESNATPDPGVARSDDDRDDGGDADAAPESDATEGSGEPRA
ncbi:MAG: ABC transporter ATP-binding protein [Haloferacaceae archaeon]